LQNVAHANRSDARDLLVLCDSSNATSMGLNVNLRPLVSPYSLSENDSRAQNEGQGYFIQGRRGHVRLHEKGGKGHEVSCHHVITTLSVTSMSTSRLPASPAIRMDRCSV
jgi:hypothetical protein